MPCWPPANTFEYPSGAPGAVPADGAPVGFSRDATAASSKAAMGSPESGSTTSTPVTVTGAPE